MVSPMFLTVGLLLSALQSPPSGPVRYSAVMAPADAAGVSSTLRVSMALPGDVSVFRAELIMPRAIPMGYGQVAYDQFVTVTAARSRSGSPAVLTRGEGPRWSVSSVNASDPLAGLDYEVDLSAMERSVLSGGDSSRARDGYVSLLGYSVFAYVEGLEDRAVDLAIAPPPNHPD